MLKKKFLITSMLFFMTISGSVCAQGVLDFTKVTENSSYEEWEKSFKAAKNIYKDFCVDSVEEFIKITEYYNKFISDGKIVHSFRTKDSEDIYCIDVYSQGSIRANGLDPSDLTFSPQSIPDEFEEKIDNPDALLKTIDFGLDGSLDENGNARQCPKGSFPKLIPKLENLYKFKYLENLFKKYPMDDSQCNCSDDSKAALSASANSSEHVYATAYQWVNHRGLRAEFNLWSPYIQGERDFSLSQLWVSRGDRDSNTLQTVETGWQEYEYLNGDKKSRLFVYYTPDSYNSGCYNLYCEAFVQVDSSIVVGGSFGMYSAIGGDQYSVELMFMRDESPPHHWWLKVYDTWVGYYPNTLFNSQGIADYSDLAQFGGEVLYYTNGGDFTSTDMGSGRFPHEGFKYAAYIKGIKYVDMDFQYRDPDKLAGIATYPNYYDIDLLSSEDENWGSYFYFGGPGKNTDQTSTTTTSTLPTTSTTTSSITITTITTTMPVTTTTSSSISTTTTIEVTNCLMEGIYGEDSEELASLRDFRNNVLAQTSAGQEIIKLYYQWSPAIVKAMEADEEFKQEIKEIVDGVLEMIEGRIE